MSGYMWAPTADELLGQFEADERRTGTVRFPFAAGILARGDLADTIAFGRSLDLNIDVHYGSGWLIRRGYIVATGNGAALYRFVQRLAITFEWSD